MDTKPLLKTTDAPVIYQISKDALETFAQSIVNFTLQGMAEAERGKTKDKLLSREAVAKMLDVDLSTLYRWEQRGVLIPVRIGTAVRYKESDINKMLNAQ